MNQEKYTMTLWRAVPFVMAMLLVATLAVQPTMALFGLGKTEAQPAADGAPIAQNMEIRVYRNIPFTGKLTAVDNEGDEVTFSVVSEPSKGVVSIEDDTFVYTPMKNKIGADSFTYAATDSNGNTSAPATVKIVIERSRTNMQYDDMKDCADYTAAVDLAEHGVLIGTQIGGKCFFEPERTVSRGEFVTMALAVAGIEPAQSTLTGFCDDEAIPTWAKGSAVSAVQGGIIYGVGTAEGVAFQADSDVTLAEAATVLNRLLRVTDVDLPDYYGDDAPAWSAQAVANLESISILESGSFSNENLSRPITRAEAARLLSAALTLVEEKQSGGLIGELLGK